MLQSEYLEANIGVDTAENRPRRSNKPQHFEAQMVITWDNVETGGPNFTRLVLGCIADRSDLIPLERSSPSSTQSTPVSRSQLHLSKNNIPEDLQNAEV